MTRRGDGGAGRTFSVYPLATIALILCAGLGFLTLAGCATKVIEPEAGTPLRYPDFVFPAVSPGSGSTETMTLVERGWRSLQAGDLRSAEQAFDKAVQLAPSFYAAATGLGYVRLAERSYPAALAAFDGVLRGRAGYVPALVGRGEALLGASRPREALESFQNALAQDPSLTEVQRRVEVLSLRLQQDALGAARRAADAGNYDDARQAYQRAIDASPTSAFLYRDLAGVERLAGDLKAALAHSRQATDLDPGDARSWTQLGELLEASKDNDGAFAVYARAAELEPGAATNERLERVRRLAAQTALPPEFQHIAESSQTTRGELAALVGIRLTRLVEQASPHEAVVITDLRGQWAAAWIQAVTRAGLMDVYPNHEFQPAAPVRRADLAVVASRILQVIGAADPRRYQAWQRGRPLIADIPNGNVHYAAAALVVTAGVMPLVEGGAFLPARPVGGAEALDVLARLEGLGR